MDDRTSSCVHDIQEIEPITFTGMSKTHQKVVNKLATVELTFVESGLRQRKSTVFGCVVIPGLNERLILGCPTLD